MSEHLFFSLSFIVFILSFFISYKYLYKATFYNWKINLLFTLSYLIFLVIIIWLLNKTNNLKILVIVGSLIVPPFTTFEVSASKYFLDKNSNSRKIITKEKNEKNKF